MDRIAAFKDAVAQLSAFEGDARAVRLAPRGTRRERVLRLVECHGGRPAVRDAVVLELLRLVRDHVGWQDGVAGMDEPAVRASYAPPHRRRDLLGRAENRRARAPSTGAWRLAGDAARSSADGRRPRPDGNHEPRLSRGA